MTVFCSLFKLPKVILLAYRPQLNIIFVWHRIVKRHEIHESVCSKCDSPQAHALNAQLGGRIFSYVLIAGVRRLQYIAVYRKSKSKIVSRSACIRICYQVQYTVTLPLPTWWTSCKLELPLLIWFRLMFTPMVFYGHNIYWYCHEHHIEMSGWCRFMCGRYAAKLSAVTRSILVFAISPKWIPRYICERLQISSFHCLTL